MRALLSSTASFTAGSTAGQGSPIHDAVAVAHVARPDLLETVDRGVKIETRARARAAAARMSTSGDATGWEPNAHVAVDIRADDFLDLLVERLNSLS